MTSPVDLEWLAEVRERAPAIAAAFANGIGQGTQQLSAPGCPKGCITCYRECAVRHIKMDWWTTAHAKAELAARQHAPTSSIIAHENVIHASFGGRMRGAEVLQ